MPAPARFVRRRTATLLLFFGLSCAAARGQSTLTWGTSGNGGSGTWDTTTADWYNGTSAVPWTNGDAAVFAGTAGTVSINGSVTASQVTFNSAGYVLQNFFLVGASTGLTIQTNADATIASSIFGAAPYNTTFTKTGSGVLSLGGPGSSVSANGPVFFGSAVVAAGEMRFLGTSVNYFTSPAVLANAAGVLLTFAAPTNIFDSLAGGGSNGGVVQPFVTSGSLTLTLNGSDSTSFAGVISDNGSAALALQKIGTGTQTLTGANTFSGTTTVTGGQLVLAGANGSLASKSITVGPQATLLLDNTAAANTGRLSSTPGVTLNGGTLAITGNATAASKTQVGGVTFSGASNLTATSNGAAVQLQVAGGLTRSNNGTLSFSDGGNVLVSGLTNTNGIVAPWATVNGTDWAALNANNTISAYAGYTTNLTTATSQDNLRLATAGGTTTTLTQSTTRNTLDLVNTGGTATTTLDLGAGHALTLTAGGLLTSGNTGQVIQNGTLTTSGSELVVTNQAALAIASTVADSGSAVTFTKSGAGTLLLTGMNTYTGPTVVVQGTLQASTDANLGAGSVVALNGGTLQAGASFTSSKSLQGTGGTLDTAAYNVAFTGGTNTGSFTKAGAGMLTLSGNVSNVTINAGVLRLTNLASGNAASLTLNAGRLEASGSGVQTVTVGAASAQISPGAIGEAATLTLATLNTTAASATIDFDLGSTATDSVSVTSSLNISGSQLLFRFNDIGGTRTGVAYPLLTSSSLTRYFASSFGFDPASTAAGYQGTFSLSNNVLSVTLSAVPEPGAALWLLAAVAIGGAARLARRRRGRLVSPER